MATREVAWPHDIAAVARSLAGAQSWFWLDGDTGEGTGRSYLGIALHIEEATRGAEHEFLHRLRARSDTNWVVAFSYEFGVALMGEAPAADAVPPAFALQVSSVLVLNHETGRAQVHGCDAAAVERFIAQHEHALQPDPSQPEPSEPDVQHRSGAVNAPPTGRWRSHSADYLQQLAVCNEAIVDGEAYVLCLTDTCEVADVHMQPLDLYLRLRQAGPEVRGGVIATATRALVSASPERFLSVRGRHAESHPMKGTRARGLTAAEDAMLVRELAADPKERAENLMIVDLVRNDLSRVCEPGTVRTEGFLRIETHQRVHQLVSTVSGQLRDGCDVFDVIESAFPGASMTGAPKRRAVQILAELERGPRGLYSGCFGWIGEGARSAELAMTIRSIELRTRDDEGSTLAFVGAGGGVTADSDPQFEVAEKGLKAEALLNALAGETGSVQA
jgi:para-aminobenzoate synthetase component 1